jgi:hypothetical protein
VVPDDPDFATGGVRGLRGDAGDILVAGYPQIALVGLAVRMVAAAAAMQALGVLSLSELAFVPLRDLFGFAVWCGGLVGNHVEWRGERFRLLRDGRMVSEPQEQSQPKR